MSASPRPNAKASQALKMRLSELYIGWITSADVQNKITIMVEESLAASEGVQGTHHHPATRYTDPQPLEESAKEGHSTSPSPPPSPPLGRRINVPKNAKDERTSSPVHLSTRFLGVDEVDMNHRSTSPGGASPVSPNTALHKAVVDPSMPLAPQQLKFNAEWPEEKEPNRERHSPVSSASSLHAGPPHSSGVSPNGSFSIPSVTATPVPVASLSEIPLFYAGGGETEDNEQQSEELHALEAAFSHGSSRKVDTRKVIKRQQFPRICTEVFAVPEWLHRFLYRRIATSCGRGEEDSLSFDNIKQFYMSYAAKLTPNRRLFDVLRTDSRRQYLTMDDLVAAMKQLVQNHSGLSFLTQQEFQDFYCRTVAVRIMYHLERQQNRKIHWQDFDRSDLPETMRLLDKTSDINHVLQYFSYEHFYVLYCRFWEIDTDKDQLVGLEDLQNYAQGALTTAVLERIVDGAGRRLSSHVRRKLDFEDFIYFCLSEEDKNTAPATRYWFQVLDLDQDGVLSGYEMEQLWPEQEARFREYSSEELRLDDMMCQMLDMVGANKIRDHPQGLTLGDLKSCPTPANFFNMIFNASKFLGFEHRDPFGEHQQKQMPEKTDWDRFARLEYDRMATEASGN